MSEPTVTVIPDQGREGLSLPSPINMDWTYPDRDVPHPVHLLVYPPSSPEHTWRDLHWSVAWQPAPGAWRHVQVDTYDVKTDPAPQPRYVFWGTRTSSTDESTEKAAHLPLGTLDREQRRKIEALAWETPVMYPNGDWNCQNWVRGLFEKMVEAGLVEQQTVDKVVKQAEIAHGALPGR
ncbi:hypothetical protein K466DRAFT_645052 [Polyporus arcularius HHB13444]|uniref:Uncharacterized protein n=1 Tax=Polyporus arcularius HHB13444 TaxID=1314778 RepID=A0A5C3PSY7_9APHY|nr:hypothetical protein K466DRAFT_645052 [Polyporus arcularius HHB13444]